MTFDFRKHIPLQWKYKLPDETVFRPEVHDLHHRQELKETTRVDKICDDYFISKTKFTDKVLKPYRDKMAEWYFDVKVAQKYGLVDEIL